jgi:prepilin-type N-terminal cleavage/methylation domain-containing protein
MFKSLLSKKKLQEGFTIIEVMIVLAIAGLILVVVLVAIPQLQRNQRNNARQALLARIVAEVSNYAGNNNGQIPADSVNNGAGNLGNPAVAQTTSFAGRYLSGIDVNDPSTGASVAFVSGNPTAVGQIGYDIANECGVDGSLSGLSGQNRKFAMRTYLEGGTIYCLDNN